MLFTKNFCEVWEWLVLVDIDSLNKGFSDPHCRRISSRISASPDERSWKMNGYCDTRSADGFSSELMGKAVGKKDSLKESIMC